MKVLDLFSGIGGFSLGLERAGMQTVAFCEIEPFCRAVLQNHWPTVIRYSDVRELTVGQLTANGIVPDVICGGFPCQDISKAGPRIGIDGERSGLWAEFARLIGEVRPRYVIVENVDDLAVRGLGRVLGELASLGYDAEWHCIPAAAVGADHWRDRLWIIAYPDETGVQSVYIERGEPCTPEMGKDAAYAHAPRLSWGLQTGTLCEDARAVSPWLGLALCSAHALPGLDGAGSPVLGRGENGIPNRVDRVMSLGNSVVPQIPEVIGRAIYARETAIRALRPVTSFLPVQEGEPGCPPAHGHGFLPQTSRVAEQSAPGNFLDSEYDPQADALGSFNDAIAEVARRYRAGEPLPNSGYFARAK